MRSKVYTLYQLPANSSKLFRSHKKGEPVDIYDYVGVYNGEMSAELSDMEICDELFEVFNIRHPKGFAGHSMSTSDVVRIFNFENEKFLGCKYYYCDSIGWKDITEEVEKSEE